MMHIRHNQVKMLFISANQVKKGAFRLKWFDSIRHEKLAFQIWIDIQILYLKIQKILEFPDAPVKIRGRFGLSTRSFTGN